MTMMVYLVAYLGPLMLMVDRQTIHGQSLVSTERLHNHLKVAFSEYRSFLHEDGKARTRKYIKHILSSLANYYITNIEEHYFEFINEGVKVNGTNYLWILPGSRYGTSSDKLLLLGAHYDSHTNTPGVDDNGSGMASLLEVARILSDLDSCDRLNSIGFVAFDWEEYGYYGSRLWISQYFVPRLLTRLHLETTDFQGAIILDTIMNWDNSYDSQLYPDAFEMVFPNSYKRLKANNFRGNFIMLTNRLDEEDLAKGLVRTWHELPLNNTYLLEHISLPLSGRPVDLPDIFDDFCRSDHCNFWNYYDRKTPKGIKAVFLSDTAHYRGNMATCYHSPCDELLQIDGNKLEFLAKITEMLTRYMLESSTEKDDLMCTRPPGYRWLPTTLAPTTMSTTTTTTTTQATPNPKPQTSRAGPKHETFCRTFYSALLLLLFTELTKYDVNTFS